MGGPLIFLAEHGGGKGRVGGPSLIKVRNFHLPYFGIMFEEGPLIFLNDRRVYPKNMNAFRLGPGNFFHQNIFSSIPPPT